MSRENLNLISLLENTLIFQKSHIKNKSIIKKTVKQNITSLQYIHFNICFSPNLNNKVVCNGTSLLCLHLPHAYTHTLIQIVDLTSKSKCHYYWLANTMSFLRVSVTKKQHYHIILFKQSYQASQYLNFLSNMFSVSKLTQFTNHLCNFTCC